MPEKIQELRAEFTADTKQLMSGISRANKGMTTFGDKVTAVGKRLTGFGKSMAKWGSIATAALAGVGIGVTKMAGDFQSALTDTMSMTGLTGKAYDDMRILLKELAFQHSETFGVDATKLVASYYDVLSAGAKAGTEDFKSLAEAALTLTRVTGIETGAAIEALNDSLGSFGMKISEANKMADVFFKTSQLAATTVPQLAEAMKTAGKVAAEMGISLEDTAAILAGFASTGTRAADAGTTFKMIMVKLSAPSKDATENLEKLGVAVFDAEGRMRSVLDILEDLQVGLARVTDEERKMALKVIAGEDAIDRFGALLNSDLKILRAWSEELKKSGSLQESLDKKMGDLNVQAGLLWIMIKNVVIESGDNLLPILAGVIKEIVRWIKMNRELIKQKIAEVIERMVGMAKKLWPIFKIVLGIAYQIVQLPVVPWILAILVVLAPLIAGLGFLVMGIGAALTAIGTIGVTAAVVIAVLAAIGIAVYALSDNVQEVFWSMVDAIADFVENAMAILTPWWTDMKNGFAVVWSAISGTFSAFAKLFRGDFEGFWNSIKAWWEGWKAPFIGMFSGMWDSIKGIWEGAVDLMRGVTDPIISWWRETVMPWIDEIRDYVKWIKDWWMGAGERGATRRAGMGVIGRGIEHFQEGGIVTRPTIAMIGEAGPEAVVPLNKQGQAFETSITFNGITDIGEMLRRIARLEQRMEFTRGGV